MPAPLDETSLAAAPGEQHRSPWIAHLLSAVPALGAVALGAMVVQLDQRPTGGDALMREALDLIFLVSEGQTQELKRWLAELAFHPPLPYVWAALVGTFLGPSLAAVRLASVLLHGLAVLQTRWLALALGVPARGALLASLLCAVMPGLAGWFRLDYQEPLTTVILLELLRRAITADPRRPGAMIKVGLTAGAGLLCKLAFAPLALGPALAFLALRLRGVRAAAGCLIALILAAMVWSPWAWFAREAVGQNFSMSTTATREISLALSVYLLAHPSNLALLALAVAGAILLWRRGGGGAGLWLLLAAWVPGHLLFFALFDVWGRYLLPLLPLSCVLAGATLSALIARLPRQLWRHAATFALLVVGLGAATLQALPPGPSLTEDFGPPRAGAATWASEDRRVLATGLLAPDRQRHDALFRALEEVARNDGHMLTVLDPSDYLMHYLLDLEVLRQSQGRPMPPRVDPHGLAEALADGIPVYAVHLSYPGKWPRARSVWDRFERAAMDAYLAHRREQVGRFGDASPFIVTVSRLWPP